MSLPSLLLRRRVLSKPGVGRFHVSAPWWRPNRVYALEFQPEGRDVIYPVPREQWDEMEALAFGDITPTLEQIMALVRRPGSGPGRS